MISVFLFSSLVSLVQAVKGRNSQPLWTLQKSPLHLQLSRPLHIFKRDDKYRGLVSDECIPANEDFLAIPLSSCFVQIHNERWPLQLAAKLKKEMELTKSKWDAYFRLLPNQRELQDSLPHHWSESELKIFQSDVENDEHFLYDSQFILDTICDAKKTRKSLDDATIYALDLVQTRNLGYQGITFYYHIIAVGLDLCNHSDSVNSAFRVDETKQTLHLRYIGTGLRPGSEVCLNYRFDSQESCFTSYGFVPSEVKKYALLLPRAITNKILLQSIHGEPEAMEILESRGLSITSPFEITRETIINEESPLHFVLRILTSSRCEILTYHEAQASTTDIIGDRRRANTLLRTILEEKVCAMRYLLSKEGHDGEELSTRALAARNKLLQNNLHFLEAILGDIHYL